MALAKALAQIRQTPLQDQVRVAKNCWGIIASDLDEPAATAVSQKLSAAGFASQAIPTKALSALPDPVAVNRFDALPTAGLVLISAAAVTVTTTTTRTIHQGPSATDKIVSAGILMTTGIPIKFGPKEQNIKKEQTHSDLTFYADFLYSGPSRRLRVDAQRFDYSFLKERKQYQVLGNFKGLLAEVAKRVPDAWRNQGTRMILEGKPLNQMGYGSLADLDRETLWLSTLQSLKRSPL
jgi:hypothetical protein